MKLRIFAITSAVLLVISSQSSALLHASNSQKSLQFSTKSNQPHFKPKINGVKSKVVFSTYVRSFLYDDFVDKNHSALGVEIEENEVTRTNKNGEEYFYTERFINEPIKLDDVEIASRINIRERGDVKRQIKVDGVFNVDLLGDIVMLDYRKGEMSILDNFKADEEFFSYDLDYSEKYGMRVVTLPFQVAGKATMYRSTARFIVDIASLNGIVLNRNNEAVKNYISIIEKDDIKLSEDRFYSYDPTLDIEVLHSQRIIIDEFVLNDIKNIICYKPKSDNTEYYSQYDGILGAAFFKNFTVVFDFKNNKLYLKPTSVHVVLNK